MTSFKHLYGDNAKAPGSGTGAFVHSGGGHALVLVAIYPAPGLD